MKQLVIIIIASFLLFGCDRANKIKFSKISSYTRRLESKINILTENQLTHLNHEYDTLKNEYVYYENGDSVLLDKIFNYKKKLVFYFREGDCIDCAKQQLIIIQGFTNKLGIEDFLFLISHQNARQAKTLLKQQGLNYPIYNLRYKSLGYISDSINKPLFFVVDNSRVINMLYMPIKGDTIITQRYLESVRNRYFNIN